MERVNYNYSLKNIPVPNNNSYLKNMISKVEALVRSMRWKAYFHDHTDIANTGKNNFGFKSAKAPPQNQLLIPFESDIYELIRTIEFKPVQNQFQKQLKRDIRELKQSSKLHIPADKTSNIYKVTSDEYNKLLTENITKTYKKTTNAAVKKVNEEAKSIATKLGVADRIEKYAQRNAFVTLKDHKDNFESNPKCRLINPAKSAIGAVSKSYLDAVNAELRQRLQVNQWRNTSKVIEWFKAIPDKPHSRFIKFDIAEFYPSISQELLVKAIDFAKSNSCSIDSDAIKVIMHSRKCFLFESSGDIWVKKENEEFDVTMGSYDGAEICELVGLFLLSELNRILGANKAGLYRDDGLCCFQRLSGPQLERVKKDICELFRSHGLSITIESNLVVTEFLDVMLDLKRDKYYPYRKVNSKAQYIHVQSNHPPNIIKQIPAMISKRISNNSCDQNEFDRAAPEYNKALADSGYAEHLVFSPDTRKRKQTRKRNRIWFNPPFSLNVKTNIGKEFFRLLDKHFPNHHRYYKLFNRNTVKLSYSCMPNMEAVLRNNNTRVINESKPASANMEMCSCRDANTCPLNGQCLKSCIVYKATVKKVSGDVSYLGVSERPFKERYNNHTKAFRNRQYEKDTELSKLIWKLKDAGEQHTLSWEIASSAVAYKCGGSRCDLCATEKLLIIMAAPGSIINKRDEVVSKCRHKNKFILKWLK